MTGKDLPLNRQNCRRDTFKKPLLGKRIKERAEKTADYLIIVQKSARGTTMIG
jgi:hypothetical protein